MLTAYFDDSGTHADSPILLMGGAIGNEAQWTAFKEGWRDFLVQPTKGRGPIRRFHMYDCENAVGECAGWNRADSDSAIHNARSIMLSSGLMGYAAAVEVAPWDELITGPLRVIYGDAERYAVIKAVMETIELSRKLGEQQIKFVFDNRPNRNQSNRKIHDFFQLTAHFESDHPKIRDVDFLGSAICAPLQAADVVAYEYYRATLERLQAPDQPSYRAHWRRLEESGKFVGEVMPRQQIQAIVDRFMTETLDIPPVELAVMKHVLGT